MPPETSQILDNQTPRHSVVGIGTKCHSMITEDLYCLNGNFCVFSPATMWVEIQLWSCDIAVVKEALMKYRTRRHWNDLQSAALLTNLWQKIISKKRYVNVEKVNCLTICVMCIIWCATGCNFYWLLHLQDQRMLWRQGTATVRLCEITATRPARTSDIALTCQTSPRREQNVSEGWLYDITSTLTSSSHNVFFQLLFSCFFFHSYIFRSSEVHPSTLRHLAKGILRPKAALIVKTFNAKGSSSHQTTLLIQCMKNDLVKK